MILREATVDDIAEVMSASTPEKLGAPQRIDIIHAAEEDGILLGVFGLWFYAPGVAFAWMSPTEEGKKRKKLMLRTAKDWIRDQCRANEVRRLMATVNPDFSENVRFVTHLGFKYESLWPKFFGEKPAWLYVLYMECDT